MSPLTIPTPEGSTRVFTIIGDPVVQVKAPALMNRIFTEAGVDAVMVPIHVKPSQLATVMEGFKASLNVDGVLVTIPHKFDVCAHAQRSSTTVRLSGSANALRRAADGLWEAENFDGLGFVAGLRQQGHEPKGRVVSQVGTGGAGVAIAASLVEAGVERLYLSDLAAEKSRALVDRLNAYRPGSAQFCAQPRLDGVDMVINATPMGLREEDPLPLDVAALAPATLVAEIIMKPHETRLLRVAAARGLRIHHGIHMLEPQLDMYRQFFGVPAAAG